MSLFRIGLTLEAFSGRLKSAREFSNRAVQSARRTATMVSYFCMVSCRTNLKLNSVPAGYSICSLKVLEVV